MFKIFNKLHKNWKHELANSEEFNSFEETLFHLQKTVHKDFQKEYVILGSTRGF